MSKSAVIDQPPGLSLAVQYAVRAAWLPPRARLRRWVLGALERDAVIALRFVDSDEGRRLNRSYRGKDYATNVLTFAYDPSTPSEPLSGDIVVCAPVVAREAAEQGKPAGAHCAHLVIHGVLHLHGYEHENKADARIMEAREKVILARFGIPDPYVDVT